MMNLITAERRALADVLSGLDASQWRAPSMCAGWTVAHVVAHLTMPFRISGEEFTAAMQRAGGDFTAMSDGIADRDSRLPEADLVAALRDNAENPWSPPGGGLPGALTHDVVHGLDIASPLGIEYEIPEEAITLVLDMITAPQGKSVFGVELDGIELSATDLDWSTGTGAVLSGRSRDLVLLVAGRQVPAERFEGPGVAHFHAVHEGSDEDHDGHR